MKRALSLLLATVLILALTACTVPVSTGSSQADVDPEILGRYWCDSIRMDGAAMDPAGLWLELGEKGQLTLFLGEMPDAGTWRLSGKVFTADISGDEVATGKLEGETLRLTLMGMDCVFLKGLPDPDAQEEEPLPEIDTYAVADGLYYVDYPTALFLPSEDGLTDLYSADTETSAWITKLSSQEYVALWKQGFDDKEADESILNFTRGEVQVAGYSGTYVLYQGEDGWVSEVLVPFGKDLGNKTYPMYAAYLSFAGPSREAVWGDAIQDIVSSLRLG